ncbi:hypothetical protein C8T65DRAFT_755657 [Cerioporus squamosus]|nr:hypothetical protein C8T65DRAFT_755657 [Cerioporus squamosus]
MSSQYVLPLPGLASIKLSICGDSFSAVGYSSKDRHPSAEHPLGVEFPGFTSCERINETTGEVTFEPNWVGHFVQTVNATRRENPLLVYDYAVSGDTVARMKLWQIEKEFLPHLAPHPEWAHWTSSDMLFVTWISIKNCTYNIRLQPSAAQRSFDDLFAAQEELYAAGARNFCVIDVPPAHTFHRGPKTPRARDAYVAWNPMLRQRMEQFSETHQDATRQALFVDGFHPSSVLHQLISTEFFIFVSSVV